MQSIAIRYANRNSEMCKQGEHSTRTHGRFIAIDCNTVRRSHWRKVQINRAFYTSTIQLAVGL